MGDGPLAVALPPEATCKAVPCDPARTASGSFKLALLDGGLRVLVTPFVAEGERIDAGRVERSEHG